jgi:hypothetical protein
MHWVVDRYSVNDSNGFLNEFQRGVDNVSAVDCLRAIFAGGRHFARTSRFDDAQGAPLPASLHTIEAVERIRS